MSDIFEGVSVIEPLAYPVWKAMLSAYPKNHFTAIIKQVAEQLSGDQDDTYEKLIKMVEIGIKQTARQVDVMVEVCRKRNKEQHDEIVELRSELDKEKWAQK